MVPRSGEAALECGNLFPPWGGRCLQRRGGPGRGGAASGDGISRRAAGVDSPPALRVALCTMLPPLIRLFAGALLLAPLLFAADVSPLVDRAERALAAGRSLEARDTLLRAATLAEDAASRDELLDRVGVLNLSLLLSRAPQPETRRVEIRSGDSLGRIAEQHRTTIELLRASNQLPGNTIRLGDRLKVLDAPFSVTVDKAANRLTLLLGGRFFKHYPVSTGAGGNTPTGDFVIVDRIEHPTWWHPDTGEAIPYGAPGHRIGTHWLGWNLKGFGIHGTDEPEKIGQPVSLGCVRLRNDDVAELYMLLPAGTPVTVH